MNPIRTYSVKVQGFNPVLHSARSPGKARAAAYRQYLSAYECTFRDFLKISSIERVPDPPGVGKRVMIAGLPATTCVDHSFGHYVFYMRDDSDVVLCSHPLDVTPLEETSSNTQ